MKYYRLIIECEDYKPLVYNHIYPETLLPEDWSNNVAYHAERYKNEWQLCEEHEYYLQEGLPEKYVVLNPNNKESQLLYNYTDKYGAFPPYKGGTYFHFPSTKEGYTTSTCIESNYTEITFETFKRLILKTENMEREIKYYKLKEEYLPYLEAAKKICYSDLDYTLAGGKSPAIAAENSIYHANKAGVLDLWFEPVYAEEYKVGDWVIVKGYSSSYDGKPLKIINIYPGHDKRGYVNFTPSKDSSYNFSKEMIVRKATPEEIKTVQYPQITINAYKGEFFDTYVKFGCDRIDKNLIISIWNLMSIDSNNPFKNLNSVTIGNGLFSKDQIKEIAEYYLNK